MIPATDAEILAGFSGPYASIDVVAISDDELFGRRWRYGGHDLAAAKRYAATYSGGWSNARVYQRTAGEWSEVAS